MDIRRTLGSWDDAARGDRRWMAVETIIVFAVFAVIHWIVFGNRPLWTDVDAPYHHLVMAEIHAHGFWRDITWLPWTILREAGPDHHWLWHLLLSPLAAIDDLPTRINVVNAVSFALVPAATNLALRLLGVRLAPMWALFVVAGTNAELFRLSMARAQNVAIVLLVLFMVALERRNRVALFVLPFLFMHTYHGAILLAAPGALYFAIHLARERQADWALVALPAAGGALALVSSPWYPHNIEYFLFHTLDKVGNPLGIDVGLEWFPPAPLQLLLALLPQLLVLAAVAVAAGTAMKRLSTTTLMALGMSAVVTLLALRHLRFLEYCAPVYVVAAALITRDLAHEVTNRIGIRTATVASVAAAASFVFFLGVAATARVQPDNELDRNAAVGALLEHFAAPGTVVANVSWAAFPTLAWHAPGLRFLYGLDPYYLAYEDKDRFIALYRLRGMMPAPEGEVVDVRNDLGSDWLVTNKADIVVPLIKSGQAAVVMKDAWNYVVYVGRDETTIRGLLGDGTRWMKVAYPVFRNAEQGP